MQYEKKEKKESKSAKSLCHFLVIIFIPYGLFHYASLGCVWRSCARKIFKELSSEAGLSVK